MASLQPHLSHPKYRSDIDGLRAIAVLPVVAFHAFPGWVKGGFVGVDVFFVISGYLISTIIFENLDKGTFSFAEFYARRIKRIFPALLLVLIASYAFGWFALLADEYKQLGKHIAAGAGFISNIVLWNEAGYFDNSAETKPLLHLWSLGIEEQFYIVWPLLLWLAWKRKFNLLTITMLIAVVSYYLNVKGIKKDAVSTFYSPQTRFWELLCGSLLAWVTLYKKTAFATIKTKLDGWLASAVYREKPEADGETLSNVLSFLGLFLLVYGFWRINKELGFPGKWAIVPVLGAVLIISSGPKAWVNRVILSNKVAVWFGLISFPLYLWHWPLLSFARIVENEVPSLKILIAAVVLSVVLAWLTYKLVERPLRLGKHSESEVSVLVVLMLVAGYVGYNTYSRDGLSFRIKDKVLLNEIVANPFLPVKDFECSKYISEFRDLKFDGLCKLSKDELPTVMFVGDSHTSVLRNGVWDKLTSQSVLMVAQTSCLPFSGSHFLVGDCEKKYNAVLGYLEKSSTVKTVVLSGNWAYLMSGGFERTGVNWRNAKPLSEEGARTFKANGYAFISRVLKSGKQVVFLKDIPDLDFDIKSCFDLRPLRITPIANLRHDCSMDEGSFIERLSAYDSIVDEILRSFPSVKTYNPRPLFCLSGKCLASDGTLPYYTNGDHVNHFGANLVIDGLIKEVRILK